MRLSRIVAGLAFVAFSFAAPAGATSASASWHLHGGDTFQVNAWHCRFFWRTCSWKSSTKLFGSHPKRAAWIENDAELQAHGFHATITVSNENSQATLTTVSGSVAHVRWRNHNNWIADNSGTMSPSWTTAYVSTRSCGLAKVNKKIKISKKCVYAGAL